MYGETKQGRMRRLAGLGAVALAAVAVTGCVAHNDVLVFGTNTTFGVNVQSAATGAGPSIVVGYERQEAVWMPLIANGRNSRVSNCPADGQGDCLPSTQVYPLDQALYQSTVLDSTGMRPVRTDAYSVFASLGATFNSTVNPTNGANAGGGIAQFFATGAAAQNITANPALVTALKVGDGPAQADAVEAAALSEERLAALQAEHEARKADIAYVLGCANAGTPAWTTLVASTTLSPATQAGLSTVPAANRAAFLDGHDNWIAALTTAAKAANCAR